MTTPTPPAGARATIVADFLASLVVFMVALPLCVAIAQASGLPPEAGLITGIVGGILVGLLAGSPLQVSGPAAGLIVLMLDILNDPAAAPHFGLIILLAGLIQVVAGLLKIGQWFRAVSPAVVMGMLAGIGVIILAKQAHVLFDTAAPGSIFESIAAIPGTVKAAVETPTFSGPKAAGVLGIATVIVIVLWGYTPPKVRFVPAAVVAVIGASVAAWALGVDVAKVQVAGLASGIKLIQWPGFEGLTNTHVWQNAVVVALIASAETLLCASAVDSKHSGPRTQYNRELFAQGVGNTVCGCLGVLPMTGVIVRSSANLAAGAKTRVSAILHGVWLLLFAAFFPDLLKTIPTAALAAVLIVTGWKLLEIHEGGKLWKQSHGEFAIFVITAAGVVLTDLLTGVIIGVVVTAARLLWMFSKLDVVRRDEPEHRRVYLDLDGAGTFLVIPKLAAALEHLPRGHKVHISIEGLQFVDHAILKHLMTFQKQYETTGGTVFIDLDDLIGRLHTVKNVTTIMPTDPQTRQNGNHVEPRPERQLTP